MTPNLPLNTHNKLLLLLSNSLTRRILTLLAGIDPGPIPTHEVKALQEPNEKIRKTH